MLNVSTERGITTVEIDRPPLNILTMALMEELRVALAGVAASDARALLLCGAGRAFSAGADVAEHLPGTVERMLPLFTKTLQDLLALDIPTTAFVHGSALGGGFELATACDFIVAAEDAKMGLPEITLGVFPPAVAAILPCEIGSRRALELLLSGDTISAREGLTLGLINRIGTRQDARAFVERFARHPRPSLAACKRAARRFYGDRLELAERVYLRELMSHAEPVEGLRAFLDKRPPLWAAERTTKK